jgi:hypothetical protein
MSRRSGWFVVLVAASLFMACGGSSAAPEPTLAPPPLDPRLRALGQGELALSVDAGGEQAIDPLALARKAGEPPTCADFVFLFSWRVASPAMVKFVGNRMGGEFDVAQGAEGQASVSGCILLEVRNEGAKVATGSLMYFVTSVQR